MSVANLVSTWTPLHWGLTFFELLNLFWGNVLSNVLDDVWNVDADDNEAKNTDGDLVEEPIGELAHDEGTGGEAEGGHDGEGQHDGHDRVEEVIEEGCRLHVRPE